MLNKDTDAFEQSIAIQHVVANVATSCPFLVFQHAPGQAHGPYGLGPMAAHREVCDANDFAKTMANGAPGLEYTVREVVDGTLVNRRTYSRPHGKTMRFVED